MVAMSGPTDYDDLMVISKEIPKKDVIKVALGCNLTVTFGITKENGDYYAYLHSYTHYDKKPCVQELGKFLYALKTYALTPDSKYDAVFATVYKCKFIWNSGSILTLLHSKMGLCGKHNKPVEIVVEEGKKIGLDLKGTDVLNISAQLEASLSAINAKKTATVKEPKLTKLGYTKVEADVIESPMSLSGEAGTIKLRHLQSAVMVFYMIQEASITHPEYKERKDEYTADLARTMFDYLAYITLQEAVHAKGVIWEPKQVAPYVNRDPKQFLPVIKQLFEEEDCWHDSFGGKPWANITKAAMLYFTMPPGAFFDHCVDLSHHGGLAFDKGVVWLQPQDRYKSMLDAKRDDTVLFDVHKVYGGGFEINPIELKWFMYVCGFTDEPGPKTKKYDWGDGTVGVSINQDYMGGESEDDDEESDNEPETVTKWVPERIEPDAT